MQKYAMLFVRWFRMISGKSAFHKTQKQGILWEKKSVKGYYSDLRHKVTDCKNLDSSGVPVNKTNTGKSIYFPINIFQYGLGAYDLYLETKNELYKNKFFDALNWCVQNQLKSGAWDTFGWCDKENFFSSMAQAEGVSLLCRAFSETKDDKYLECAKKAVDFMLLPVENGGTAYYDDAGNLVSLEETGKMRTVLNGMIFSIWGLYDYLLCVTDKKLNEKMLQAVDNLSNMLPQFNRGYWSNYDLEKHIASPFYHLLHIEQLEVMSELFPDKDFGKYKIIFKKYNHSWLKRRIAFIVKAIQKIKVMRNDVVIVE